MFKKELKTSTHIRAFLYRTKSGQNYLVSVGRLFNHRIGSAVHECTNLGKVADFGKELFYTTIQDHEIAWKMFSEKFLTETAPVEEVITEMSIDI